MSKIIPKKIRKITKNGKKFRKIMLNHLMLSRTHCEFIGIFPEFLNIFSNFLNEFSPWKCQNNSKKKSEKLLKIICILVEQCRPLSEWIGIFSPIFSDIATQKSMADRSERIEWQSKLIVSSGATHCVSVRRRVCEAHRRVPCLGVKWDKGRKRRRADEWKWKEGADEKLFGGRRRQRHRSTQLFFPPFSRRSIILVGRIKKKSF